MQVSMFLSMQPLWLFAAAAVDLFAHRVDDILQVRFVYMR